MVRPDAGGRRPTAHRDHYDSQAAPRVLRVQAPEPDPARAVVGPPAVILRYSSVGTPMTDYLTKREMEAMLRVSERTIERWVANGRLAVIRTPGGAPRFIRQQVEELMRPGVAPEAIQDSLSNLQFAAALGSRHALWIVGSRRDRSHHWCGRRRADRPSAENSSNA
jgi:excisionase family DNA binding protein